MSIEPIAIGIALLVIILWTWASLRNINRKLDKLLLPTEPYKKEKDPNHTDSAQTND